MAPWQHHPLIVALIDLLPAPGAEWPADKHALFMAAFEASLHVIYRIPPRQPAQRPKHPIPRIEPPY